MTPETLSSNVVNYLVWRYLQEAGYGTAALQLSRCWNSDPDTLPFAKNVSHYTLVSMLQDGLLVDRLRAGTTGERRYRFGGDHGRPYSSRNGEMLTLDEGIPAHQLAEEAMANGPPPEPAPRKGPGKRKKAVKTNGIEARMNAQVNGDVMDVDQNGSTHVTNSVRAESEVVASDAESPSVADIAISTLSIGQSTEIQTETVIDLGPSHTTWCSIEDKEKVVKQTLWGTPEAPLLLTWGKSIFQLHLVPKPSGTNSAASVHILDLGDKLPLSNFSITAVCWNTQTNMSVSAQEELVNEDGEVMKIDKLFRIIEGGQSCDIISSTTGLASTLRWNNESKLLLSISSDLDKGYIKIWTETSQNLPEWSTSTDTAIHDAYWISDQAFVVCGEGLLRIYEIDQQLAVKHNFATQASWEIVKYDSASRIIAAIDMLNGSLGIVHPNDPTAIQTMEYPDDSLSSLDFQSRPSSDNATTNNSVVLLATSSLSGVTRVWDANQPFKRLWRLPNDDDREAQAVAFSPDGLLLAAAGPLGVTIWDLNQRAEPIARWRPEDQEHGKWDTAVEGEFSLGWEPDSSRLSVALGNQIAIISMPR